MIQKKSGSRVNDAFTWDQLHLRIDFDLHYINLEPSKPLQPFYLIEVLHTGPKCMQFWLIAKKIKLGFQKNSKILSLRCKKGLP